MNLSAKPRLSFAYGVYPDLVGASRSFLPGPNATSPRFPHPSSRLPTVAGIPALFAGVIGAPLLWGGDSDSVGRDLLFALGLLDDLDLNRAKDRADLFESSLKHPA